MAHLRYKPAVKSKKPATDNWKMIKSNIEKTLDNAERLNDSLNSFLSIEREYALKRVAELDKNPVVENQILHGAAIAVKDNICTKF